MILLTDLIYVQKIRLVGSYVKFIRLNPIFRGYPRNSGRFALVKGRTMFEDQNYYIGLIFFKRYFPGKHVR